jgi:hypothetical protein
LHVRRIINFHIQLIINDSPYQNEIIQYASRHIVSEISYGQYKKGKLWLIAEKILSQIEFTKIYKIQPEIEMSFNDLNQMTLYEILFAWVSGCHITVFGVILILIQKRNFNLLLKCCG